MRILFLYLCSLVFIFFLFLIDKAHGERFVEIQSETQDDLNTLDLRPDYLIHKVAEKIFFITTYSPQVKREKNITELVIEMFSKFKNKNPEAIIHNAVPIFENWGYGAVVIGFIVIIK